MWHFAHDALGSFCGFDVDVSTSATGAHEFEAYHRFYWTHPCSNYRTSGAVLQRMCASGMILVLRNCVLKRIQPSLSGGAEVLATSSDAAEWLALVHHHFGMALGDLTDSQRDALWRVVKRQHDGWLASQQLAGEGGAALTADAVAVAVSS